jgi:hypothetical protein
MRAMARRWLPVALVALVAFAPSIAHAADDCPAGSALKSEDGFSWCQPSVCLDDGNCGPSELCRSVPLCVEVGKLDERQQAKDAAQRLVATQRCAPDETCPSTQTCSKMNRCVSKTQAERMGLLTAPAASGSATAPAGGPKKSSCGCSVPGGFGSDGIGLAGMGLALLAIGSRRIQARRREPRLRSGDFF